MISSTSNSPSSLADLSVLTTFARRDRLPVLSDRVWRIEKGMVRTSTWNCQGHVTTLGVWGKGDIVGGPLSTLEPYHVECLTTVVASNTRLGQYRYWQEALLNHLCRSKELFAIVHQPVIMERLIQLLTWLAQRFGYPVPQGYVLESILTHQEISEILCTTRVTVTRLFSRLEKEGKLVKLKKSPVDLNGATLSFKKRTILLPQ